MLLPDASATPGSTSPGGRRSRLLLAVGIAALIALIAMPGWWDGLTASLAGTVPAAYWYLVRSSGFVAFGLLWLSMAMGIMITNKIARVWPSGPTAYGFHQFVSALGLTFGFIHPLLMLGDQYTLTQIFVPFGGIQDRTVAVALGQVSLILMAIIVPSFAARWLIGQQTWRLLHYLTFPVFLMALAHGVLTGTDSGTPFAAAVYWASLSSLIVLTVYRVLVARAAHRRAALVYTGIGQSRVRVRR